MKTLPAKLVFLLAACAALMFSGCATGRNSTIDPNTAYSARPEKALVIIMRPSSFGGAISSPVFDSTGDQNHLIAILGPHEKVAYYSEPGERLFMVIGENADFMEANLEPGKIYYGIVTPRMGAWKARFSLHPFKTDQPEKDFRLDSPALRQWLAGCHFVLPNADATNYGESHAGDIQARRAEYTDKWSRMLEQDKHWRRLTPADGVSTPIQ